MGLYVFHRILIAAAIVFDIGLTYFGIVRWQRLGNPMDLVTAAGSTLVSVLFIIYLLRFNKKMRQVNQQQG